ncbi:MAG: lipoyl synthase [Clostridia bacterium]|nr:lipoyl synthase [Clostridia bacterium]
MSRLKIVTSLPQHQATVESLARAKVNTICLESNCPNVGGCFSRGTATFLILGTVCTRSCAFCAVDKGKPLPPDPAEPFRVTGAARKLGLKRVVITSVTRDDLEDGGAGYFAQTVRLLKAGGIEAVEVLIPDFQGSEPSLAVVLEARPDIFAHNLETVPRLYPSVRPGACYQRSLRVIEKAAGFSANLRIKAGIMLGLGEQESEVLAAMKDLLQAGCNMLTLGQYLQPTIAHLPVAEYLTPEMFEKYRLSALDLGFQKVWSGPLVRSSIAY